MDGSYRIAGKDTTAGQRELAKFPAKEGQFLLAMVDLITQAEAAVDDLIDVMGRATIEAVLVMSAEQEAGPRRQGKRDDRRDIHGHGVQKGPVALQAPRLRPAPSPQIETPR